MAASQQHLEHYPSNLKEDDRSSQSHDHLEDDLEVLDDEEDHLRPLFPSANLTVPVPVAVPSSVPSASAVTIATIFNCQHPILALPTTTSVSPPDPKCLWIGYDAVVLPSPPKPILLDETRQLFQRLWTDEDEIELLKGFLEYSAGQRGPHPNTVVDVELWVFVGESLWLAWMGVKEAEKGRWYCLGFGWWEGTSRWYCLGFGFGRSK